MIVKEDEQIYLPELDVIVKERNFPGANMFYTFILDYLNSYLKNFCFIKVRNFSPNAVDLNNKYSTVMQINMWSLTYEIHKY